MSAAAEVMAVMERQRRKPTVAWAAIPMARLTTPTAGSGGGSYPS